MSLKHQHWREAEILCWDGENSMYVLWCKECGAWTLARCSNTETKRNHCIAGAHGFAVIPADKLWQEPRS